MERSPSLLNTLKSTIARSIDPSVQHALTLSLLQLTEAGNGNILEVLAIGYNISLNLFDFDECVKNFSSLNPITLGISICLLKSMILIFI